MSLTMTSVHLHLPRAVHRVFDELSGPVRWAGGAKPPEAEELADSLRQHSSEGVPPDTESLRRPRLYMDLRPFVDSGPLTVRRVLFVSTCLIWAST